ncbi:hypothetical protein FRC14_007238 [Serendipita sp. 396]|nr:hypothetical protein FRC14_007238 [Serendipita sp. 396]
MTKSNDNSTLSSNTIPTESCSATIIHISPKSEDSGISVGTFVGSLIGAAILTSLIVVFFLLYMKKGRSDDTSKQEAVEIGPQVASNQGNTLSIGEVPDSRRPFSPLLPGAFEGDSTPASPVQTNALRLYHRNPSADTMQGSDSSTLLNELNISTITSPAAQPMVTVWGYERSQSVGYQEGYQGKISLDTRLSS